MNILNKYAKANISANQFHSQLRAYHEESVTAYGSDSAAIQLQTLETQVHRASNPQLLALPSPKMHSQKSLSKVFTKKFSVGQKFKVKIQNPLHLKSNSVTCVDELASREKGLLEPEFGRRDNHSSLLVLNHRYKREHRASNVKTLKPLNYFQL